MPLTACILNFNRVKMVGATMNHLLECPAVGEIIVWNNNPAITITTCNENTVRCINSGRDLGLLTRFASCLFAKNDAILIQDEDLWLPTETIDALYAEWRKQPECIHGLDGRTPGPGGQYVYGRTIGTCPIVLTRAMVFATHYAESFWTDARPFRAMLAEGNPPGNGEDIVFSYCVRKRSGKMNVVHDLPFTELPDTDAIHSRPGHIEHRTRIVQACEEWLKEKSP